MNGQRVENKGISANLTAIFTAATFSLMTFNAVFNEPSAETREKRTEENTVTIPTGPAGTLPCHVNVFNDAGGEKVFVMHKEFFGKFGYPEDANYPLGQHSYTAILDSKNSQWGTGKFRDCDLRWPNTYIAIPESVVLKMSAGSMIGYAISLTKQTINLNYNDNDNKLIYILQNNPNDLSTELVWYDFWDTGKEYNLRKSNFSPQVNHLVYE